jgi:peptidoglycan/xylan/chitin deacetylase (PgdA/CDA1 family)
MEDGAPAGGSGSLGVGPRWLYSGKALLVRARSGRWLLTSRGRADTSGIRFLFYHRVSDDRDELAVTPARFQDQMAFLAREGYRVTDVVGAVDLLAGGEPLSRVVCLSFDDGYRDVAENALPVLAAHGFRATVFLATGVIDGTAPLSWYEHQPPLLGWDEIAGLDRAGTLTFEAHTVTHPNLLALDEADARREISGSKVALEARLGRPVSGFCYPAGLFGPRERELVAQAGFRIAVSCEPGVNSATTDRLALRRIQIDARDRLLDFRAKLGGGHDTPLLLRGRYRRSRYGMGEGSPRAASSAR